jgi:ABC-type glycerol-3-phosphate transport system permease component
MPIIAQVGRSKFSARCLFALIYLILSAGAVTIIYPFVLMLSSSVTTRLDYDRFELLPLSMKGHAGRFLAFLADRYNRDDWTLFQAAYRDRQVNFWDELADDPAAFLNRQKFGSTDEKAFERYREFLKTMPGENLGVHSSGGVQDRYDREVFLPLSVELTPAEQTTELSKWLPQNSRLLQVGWTPPSTGGYKRIQEFFHTLTVEQRAVITGRALWIQWLQTQWSLASLNAVLGANYESLFDVPFLEPRLREDFFAKGVPPRLQGQLPEFAYARFLGSSEEWVDLPVAEFDYHLFRSNEGANFAGMLTKNYRMVFSYLFTKGRAATNTIILVFLSVLTALTVNPLAAYVLARYKLSFTSSILLFCLATSAFPAEVSMIPSFLLLRDLGFLNTFAALVLPGAASGFSIFLLKGFFESLPRELYEAAEIDGAGEIRKFLMITVPLSAPILAVTALGAFTGAYTGYMWAFVVCQKEEIWTLMVWLFQFQQSQAGSGNSSVGMAALVVASVPTFLVFLFCQKIIMRGIIVPSMK